MEEYVLSLSYGKDSLACLGAIEQLGWPLDRIIHAEVWATDTIPADLPPMVEFKSKADKIIKDRWGIDVEHLCAARNGEKLTYEKLFYHVPKRKPGGKFRDSSGGGNLRIPVHNRSMVQETQRRDVSSASRSSKEIGVRAISNDPVYGFPVSVRRGNWCTALKTRVFLWPHCTRGWKKYCAVSRHSC